MYVNKRLIQLQTLQDINMCHVVKACSLSPHECVRKSQSVTTQAIMQSKVRGAAFLQGFMFRAPTMCIGVSTVWNCVYVFFIGALRLGSKVKVSKGQTFTHSILAGMHELVPPPKAWTSPRSTHLPLSSVNHPSQPLSLCIEGFDVCFDTLHWFINAVIHFLNPFLLKCQTSKTTFLEMPFFLLLGEDLSHSEGSLQSCWLSSTPDVLSSHLPPFICKEFSGAWNLGGQKS